MNLSKNKTLMIATLLTAAALICLAIGARLLIAASGQVDGALVDSTEGRIVGTVTLIGGAVVFLLSTVAILAARRFAVAAQSEPEDWAGQLHLSSIQAWSQDLSELRDDLRREGFDAHQELALEHLELEQVEIEVPSSWQAKGDYLTDEAGTPLDPLTDLKHTRDQLMAAATRVDDIVQSINASTLTPTPNRSSTHSRRRWWHL